MIANCRMNLWLLRSVRGHRKPRDPSNFRGLVQRRKCRIPKKACDSPCRFDPSHTCMSLPKPYFSESARIKSGVTVLGDLLRTIMAGGCQIEFSWRMGAKKRKGWHLTGPLRIVHCSLQPCVGTYDLIGGPETRLSGSETLADSDCYDESECFVRCRSLWHCSRAWMAQKKHILARMHVRYLKVKASKAAYGMLSIRLKRLGGVRGIPGGVKDTAFCGWRRGKHDGTILLYDNWR